MLGRECAGGVSGVAVPELRVAELGDGIVIAVARRL